MEERTVNTYNLRADEYDQQTAHFWEKFPNSVIVNFARGINRGKVLDVGSGPGRDGIILKNFGQEVICLDAAESMVKLTHQKGFPSIQADFLQLPFSAKTFVGIWAYTSFIHIPKQQLPQALLETKRVLQDNGILGLGIIEGDGEKYTYSLGNLPRFFAFYRKEEVEDILEQTGFKPFYFEQFKPGSRNYLNFLASKVIK